ncbi:MAG TPA: Pvc16 family protein [Geminicoccaceae bacterium]
MPLFDLSHVTSSLAEALRLNIHRLEPTLIGQLQVSTMPPERVSGEMNTVNLYLYHAAEDPHYRNLVGNLSDARPVQTKPMSLILYYILTTHHEVSSGFDTVTEQRLMGYALKTLHDYAVIDDDTEIGGTEVLHAELRGRDNRLEVSLRPVTPEDSVAFWSAEDRQTARLSAYYEVRYALLEPEPPRRLPGVVLSLGTFIVDMASPQLAGSRSEITFTLPAAAGGGAQTIVASPARVGPPPDGNRLTLLGSNLATGQARRLYLRNARWRQRAPELERVLVDPDLPPNAAAGWTIHEASDRIDVTLGTELTVAVPAAPPVVLPMEPGSYHARLEVVKELRVIQGQLKEITDTSNETTFAVSPRVIGAAVVDPAQRRIRIDLDASVDLTPAGPPGPLDIMVVVDGETYERHDPAVPDATFDVGEFEPANATLDFRARFDPAVAGAHPFRLIVEGAESQPFWIELP